MNKLLFWFQILVLSPIIFLIILISPIITIRIARLKSYAIGSLALPVELFLCEKKNGSFKKNEIFLWYHDRKVVNKFILKKRKEKLIFIPGYILCPLHIFFSKFKFTEKFVYIKVEYNKKIKKKIIVVEQLVDKKNLILKYQTSFNFTEAEKILGEKFLAKNNIFKNDKFVCFASRSKFFRNENYNSLRNSSITSQLEGINFLTINGYKAVRMGRDRIQKIEINKKEIFDYSFCDNKQDFLDFLIISKCEFMISGDSGIQDIATIMRIPKIIINFVDFKHLNRFHQKLTPIILPKKIFYNKEKRFLTYKETFQKKIFEVATIEQIPKEFKVIDNTSEEILNATKEMHQLIDKKNFDLEFHASNQKKFWQINNFYHDYFPERQIISPSFFLNNVNLFI